MLKDTWIFQQNGKQSTITKILGCLTYADPFIKKLAEMRKPLQVKIKDKILRHWDDKDSEYIAKIKKQLISLPKLYLPAKDDFRQMPQMNTGVQFSKLY